MTDHLTDILDKDIEDAYRLTPSGMAHLAGSGPKGKTCRECLRFCFDRGKPEYWAASNRLLGNSLKPARCSKFREMTKLKGEKFPAATPACKYFEQSDDPPKITKVWRL